LDSTSHQVLNHTGNRPAIMFSVDACHTFHCTLNDLNLAKSALHPEGIIMLDDVFNPGWPGVMLGLGQFLADTRDTMTPFAFGLNKYFIANVGVAMRYINALKDACEMCRIHKIAASWNPSTFGNMINVETMIAKLN
jgi:hypothetical protein